MNRIGVDLGGTKIAVAVMSPEGDVLFENRLLTPIGDYHATLAAIVTLVREAETAVGMVAGSGPVGIGIPGAESAGDATIKNANSTVLNGQAFHRDLAELLQQPLRLANDANCLALSEAFDGAGANAKVVFGVILGTGVGGGLVINGALIGGANRIAGEWGHNPLPWPQADEQPGQTCYCGATGCIETWLSGPALLADYRRNGGGVDVISAAAVCDQVGTGDGIAEAVLKRYYQRLARGLAAVINLIDPDVIVVGGGLSNHLPIYQQVPALWHRWVFSDRVDTRLCRADHGDASGVRGAARLWGLDDY
ncbi:MAG: ROK family protein [Immundisolibacteraceae bacterium]|nr:ROK family protein [Immundisolibacteraceae bacterium]